MESLRRRLGSGALVLDGGVGTELLAAIGAAPGEGCLELLSLTRPDVVRGVHEAFLRAGCDVVTTNSFLGTAPELERHGLAERVVELARSAARLAREAADAHSTPDRPRCVLGSLGPGSRPPSHGLLDAYREQASALVEGGVDGLLVETCNDPAVVRAALEGVQPVRGELALVVSFAPPIEGRVGEQAFAACLEAVVPFNVDVLSVNCANGPAALAEPLEWIARFVAERFSAAPRLGAYPNAGIPKLEHGRSRHPLEPSTFAAAMVRLVHEHDLALVGGCCGTTPKHIAHLVQALAR